MRTDAKIGFAIVGVLLAVLTVYAIVVPKHSNTKKTGVALVQTTPTGADTPAPAPLIGTGDTGSSSAVPPTKDNTVPHNETPGPLAGTPGTGNGTGGPGALGSDAMAGSGDRVGDHGGVDLTHHDPLPPTGPVAVKPPKTTPAPYNVPDSSKADRVYTIQAGQTLSKIAYEVYGNARFHVAIQRENPGLDPNHLKIGSKIKLPDITPLSPDVTEVHDDGGVIPPPDMVLPAASERHSSHPSAAPASSTAHTYAVKSGDNLYAIARKLLGSGRKADQIYALNKDLIGPDKTRLKLGMVLKLPEQTHTAIAE